MGGRGGGRGGWLFRDIALKYFAIEKHKEAGSTTEVAETREYKVGLGSGKFRPPCPVHTGVALRSWFKTEDVPGPGSVPFRSKTGSKILACYFTCTSFGLDRRFRMTEGPSVRIFHRNHL